ncbi:hypothetical protein HK102_004642, partial [Quaeritorhiza haematococci]
MDLTATVAPVETSIPRFTPPPKKEDSKFDQVGVPISASTLASNPPTPYETATETPSSATTAQEAAEDVCQVEEEPIPLPRHDYANARTIHPSKQRRLLRNQTDEHPSATEKVPREEDDPLVPSELYKDDYTKTPPSHRNHHNHHSVAHKKTKSNNSGSKCPKLPPPPPMIRTNSREEEFKRKKMRDILRAEKKQGGEEMRLGQQDMHVEEVQGREKVMQKGDEEKQTKQGAMKVVRLPPGYEMLRPSQLGPPPASRQKLQSQMSGQQLEQQCQEVRQVGEDGNPKLVRGSTSRTRITNDGSIGQEQMPQQQSQSQVDVNTSLTSNQRITQSDNTIPHPQPQPQRRLSQLDLDLHSASRNNSIRKSSTKNPPPSQQQPFPFPTAQLDASVDHDRFISDQLLSVKTPPTPRRGLHPATRQRHQHSKEQKQQKHTQLQRTQQQHTQEQENLRQQQQQQQLLLLKQQQQEYVQRQQQAYYARGGMHPKQYTPLRRIVGGFDNLEPTSIDTNTTRNQREVTENNKTTNHQSNNNHTSKNTPSPSTNPQDLIKALHIPVFDPPSSTSVLHLSLQGPGALCRRGEVAAQYFGLKRKKSGETSALSTAIAVAEMVTAAASNVVVDPKQKKAGDESGGEGDGSGLREAGSKSRPVEELTRADTRNGASEAAPHRNKSPASPINASPTPTSSARSSPSSSSPSSSTSNSPPQPTLSIEELIARE